ncbi:Membrane magnesium transporter 1 [Tyrophagus putrescentiae]|nr:Membrane magnesium transporter 1 [Tyrophagus putrescentiae]
MLSKIILVLGFCSLLHAAFSAAQYRSFLRVAEQDFTGHLPADIIAQAVVSLLITMYGVVSISGQFKVIYADDDFDRQKQDLVFSTPKSFVTFNHRGQILTRSSKGN